MTERLTLPVLPLRDVVLFPGVTAPIGAGRPMTLKAIEAALASPDKLVFAVAQKENIESVSADGLHLIGTITKIGLDATVPPGDRAPFERVVYRPVDLRDYVIRGPGQG